MPMMLITGNRATTNPETPADLTRQVSLGIRESFKGDSIGSSKIHLKGLKSPGSEY